MVFISTASVLVLVTACKMPTAQQEGDERPNVSPSVLFEDDACLGGESRGAGTEMSHCSFDLLQKSGLYSSSQSRPLKELTGRAPSEISTTGDKSGSQELSRSAKHFLVGGRLADSRVGLQAAPSALLTGMSSLAAEVISLGQATPEIKRLAQMYREVLDKGPAKELIEAHKRLKSMFLAQHNALARCAVELDARLESSRQLEEIYKNWERMQQECNGQEADLSHDVAACSQQLENLTSEKMQACNNFARSSPADPNFDAISKLCHSVTQDHEEQSVICEQMQGTHRQKLVRCDSLLLSVETAGCAHASSITGICDGYEHCAAGSELLRRSGQDVYEDWVHNSQHEWSAVEAVRCLSQVLGNNSMVNTSDGILTEISRCQDLPMNSTRLEIALDSPTRSGNSTFARSCPTLKASPCKAIRRAPRHPSHPSTVPSAAEVAARAALMQDSAAEDADEVGVSLMQGRPQDVTSSMPPKMYVLMLPLSSALATPYVTSLTVLAALMMLLRCSTTMHAAQEENRTAQAKRKQTGSDQLHPDISQEGAEEAQEAGSHLLCPELCVPYASSCTIAIPVTPTGGNEVSVSLTITDKLGQPLFGVSLLRTVTKPDKEVKGTFLEHLVLSAQDGTVLATCQLRLPSSGDSKDQAQCHILQRNGRLFAWLKKDTTSVLSKGSWLFRAPEKAAPESNAESLVFAVAEPTVGKLKVQGDFAERSLSITDASNQTLAKITRNSKQAFDTGGRVYYKAEVGHARGITDLGLIASIVLVTDRLLSQ